MDDQGSLIQVGNKSSVMLWARPWEWFEKTNKHEFKVQTWSPNSTDLNPIQHLWDVLDNQVSSTEAPPHELKDVIKGQDVMTGG